MQDNQQSFRHKSGTVSLPKIGIKASTKQQSSTKIPLEAIHKVRWSIAPQCLMDGHQGKQIMYVCINPDCQQLTRLVCQACYFRNHAKHNESFIAVDQVKGGSIDGLRYWPFENKYRKIYQFVTKHEHYVANMVQDVNATFNAMAMRILNSIDKIRLNLLKEIDSFYLKHTTKNEFCDKVKQDLEGAFQLKKLQETVRQIFSKEIRHSIFQKKMKDLLNDQSVIKQRRALLNYFQSTQKGNDMFFDKIRFLKKENWIIQQIHSQKAALKEIKVTVDQSSNGVEKIIPQILQYLNRASQELHPLTFVKKALEDGSEYVGFLKDGQRALLGMRTYKSGFIYYGEWAINGKNGWGVYQNKGVGYRFSGQWKQDKRNGFGREETLTSVFQGNFLNDKKDGFGVLMENGVRYEICWKNDRKHGVGKRIQKNGIQAEIYYMNGVQSQMKSNKANPSFDLKELTKRFTSTTGDRHPQPIDTIEEQKKQI